jgi:uncharacterized protein (DUF2141 family)
MAVAGDAADVASAGHDAGQKKPRTHGVSPMRPFPPTLNPLSSLLAALGPIPAIVLGIALVLPQPAAADPAAKLTLTVTGIKEAKGALMVGVYDQAGYDTDKQVTGAMVPVTAFTASTTFDLPPGRYGIKLFHDVDGDGKMSTNPFGMPLEPFGFSNNAPAQFGPATWDAAAFDVTGPAAHAIKLN